MLCKAAFGIELATEPQMEFSAHKGTTSISLVRDALQGAELRGLDVATVLSHAHIDPRLLDQRYARVPAGTFSRLWIALADLLDDEFLRQTVIPFAEVASS